MLFLLLAAACAGAVPPPVMPADHPPIGNPETQPQQRHVPPATVMARVGKDVVTAGEVEEAVNAVVGPERFEYSSPGPLRELVDVLVDRKLMARAARAAGAPASSADNALAEAWLARELDAIPPPSEASVMQYYREHMAEFTAPARVRVTRAVANSKEAAEGLRGELSRGATADDLLTRHAADVGSVEDLWMQDVAKKPELVAVALRLKPGEVSPAVPLATGFAVMRAEEVAAARILPFDEVRAGISARLETSARQAAMPGIRRQLRAGVEIVIVDEALISYLGAPVAPRPGSAKQP